MGEISNAVKDNGISANTPFGAKRHLGGHPGSRSCENPINANVVAGKIKNDPNINFCKVRTEMDFLLD